jgi:hypothetical protein
MNDKNSRFSPIQFDLLMAAPSETRDETNETADESKEKESPME